MHLVVHRMKPLLYVNLSIFYANPLNESSVNNDIRRIVDSTRLCFPGVGGFTIFTMQM